MWEAIGHHTRVQLREHGPAYAKWLRPRLRSGEVEAWVAEVDGEVVASGSLWWRPDQPRPGLPESLPYILSMFTASTARRRGVATAIVRRLVRAPRAKGADRVLLHASEDGRAVYERLGFESTNEMRLWLRRPAWARAPKTRSTARTSSLRRPPDDRSHRPRSRRNSRA